MRFTFCTILNFLLFFASAQSIPWKSTHNWKVYNISGGNIFSYSADTLKGFSYCMLDEDSMQSFLSTVSILPSDDAPVWMGAHLASYEKNEMMYKVEISQYGGFFYDEKNQQYFQVSPQLREKWHDYIRRCFMSFK